MKARALRSLKKLLLPVLTLNISTKIRSAVFFLLTLDLVVKDKIKISLSELKEMKKESREEVAVAYKFLKAQSKACLQCGVTTTLHQTKYILPCYCTFCRECLSHIAEDLIGEEIRKSTKAGTIEFKECLPRCKEHNLPFYLDEFTQLPSKKKQRNACLKAIKELTQESKFKVKISL